MLTQSRFLTHSLVLLAAAVVPVFAALHRSQSDTAYGVIYAASNPPLIRAASTQVDEIPLTQGGFIMKADTSVADAPPRRDIFVYIMKPGDTIENVAARFGLTINTVMWANHLFDVTIGHAGFKLVIPPVNGVLVKVTAGMTLEKLSQQYHVNVQDVIDFNYLRDPSHLQLGSLLMLPDGQGPAIKTGRITVPVWSSYGALNQTVVYYGSVGGSGGHFPYGYCTWWVAHKRYVPWNGDAWQWWYNARQFGFQEGQYPAVGAIMVQGITAWSPVGHVAYVEKVYADGSFMVSEMNYGRWGVVDYRTIRSRAGQDILGFIY